MRPSIARRKNLSAAAWARLNAGMTEFERDGHPMKTVRHDDLERLLGTYERLLSRGAEPSDQYDLLPPSPESMQLRRLRKFDRTNPERIYAAEWKKRNRERLSRGWTLLEAILCPDGTENYPPPVSRRDATVAASVVQWFGTNVGGGFVRACERAIDAAHRRQDESRGEKVQRERESLLELERRDRPPVPHKMSARRIALDGRV